MEELFGRCGKFHEFMEHCGTQKTLARGVEWLVKQLNRDEGLETSYFSCELNLIVLKPFDLILLSGFRRA